MGRTKKATNVICNWHGIINPATREGLFQSFMEIKEADDARGGEARLAGFKLAAKI